MPSRRTLALTAVSLAMTMAVAACSSPPTPSTPPTPSPSPTVAQLTPSASPTLSAHGQLLGACLQQVNEPEGAFTSYIQASLNWQDPQPKQLLLLIEGTNDDEAAPLTLGGPVWQGRLGLRELGPKTISSLLVVYSDGSGADVTSALEDFIGGGIFELREGATDAFGTCDI